MDKKHRIRYEQKHRKCETLKLAVNESLWYTLVILTKIDKIKNM